MVTNFDKEYLENLHLDMLMLKKSIADVPIFQITVNNFVPYDVVE